jgi:CreA protein
MWGGPPAQAESVGCVSTTFRVLGLANDKICVDSFDDPKVQGVVCHVSRAVTGGIKGKVGLAEDTSDASIACRQVGPITIKEDLKDGEDVFKESRSFLFKKLQVVRFYGKPNNTLVWPAAGSEDTELGVNMGPEVDHGTTEVYARVQA